MAFDFSRLNTPEYKQKQKEREEQRKLEEEKRRVTACFTGHRPDKLGGCYSLKHPTAKYISDKLKAYLEHIISVDNYSRFITGGAIGFDQIAFWTIQSIKQEDSSIKNIVAVPFKNQAIKWTDKETQSWYKKMLDVADEVIYVDEIAGYGVEGVTIGDYHVTKMQKRNEFMVDNSNALIACYDGTKGGTGNCVKYAMYNKRGTGMLYAQMHPNHDYEFVDTRYIY